MVYLRRTIAHINRIAVVLVTAVAMAKTVVASRAVGRATGADIARKRFASPKAASMMRDLLQASRHQWRQITSRIRSLLRKEPAEWQ